jgi:hypothetical protein
MFTGNVVVKLLYDPLQVLLNCPALLMFFCHPPPPPPPPPRRGNRKGGRGKAKGGRTGERVRDIRKEGG